MDISLIVTGIGIVVSFAGIMCAIFRNFKMDIDKKFAELHCHSLQIENRMDLRFNKIDDRFQFLEQRMNDCFNRVSGRFDHIDSEIKEIRTSVNRIEGALYSHYDLTDKISKVKKKDKVV